MNIVTRVSNGVKMIIGKVFPEDANNNKVPDSVERFEVLVNEMLRSASALTVSDVYLACKSYWDVSLTGEEKRRLVFNLLKQGASECASWVLYAAIEVAVGRIEAELKKG